MYFANIIKAIILGIVEGITEWLPISSTGHLILVDEFIKLDASAAFMNMFNVVIQLGAILAVVTLYFDKLNPFSAKKDQQQKKTTWELWFKVMVAFLPSAVIGLLINDFLEAHFQNFVSVAVVLIIYGVGFIYIERLNKTRKPKCTDLNRFSYKAALIIGFFQVLSLVPGTSRSGATILGGIMIGASRFVATEFSFFLGIPTMFAASGYKMLKFFLAGNALSLGEVGILLTGTLVSFVVSVVAIRFLMNYIKQHDFTIFGWYRIVLGGLLLIYWLVTLLIK